jgi:endonuclease-3
MKRKEVTLGRWLTMTARAKVGMIIGALEELLGVPKLKRERPDPVELLIATLLSQHTNDRNSHRAFVSLKKEFPDWNDVLAAPAKRIASAIRIGGMADQKSLRIKEILRVLKKRYGSVDLRVLRDMDVDRGLEELQSLKGVGVKTAACVFLFSLRREVFPVDTHVHRVLNLLGVVTTKTPEKTFSEMRGLVPPGTSYSLHTNLIRFGRLICRAQKPLCGSCPLYTVCEFPGKEEGRSRTLPSSRTRGEHRFMLLDNV